MSNNIIGDIYRQVIDKVIRAAENDFEEGGYPRETLDELKAGWEHNLSKLHVAHMPWDPPPHAAAPPQQQHQQQQPSIQKHDIKDAAIAAMNGPAVKNEPQYEPRIKAEPKFEPDVPSYPALNRFQGNAINPMAGHRAAANMLQQFGPQANASIRAAGLPQEPRQLNHTAGQQPQQPQQQQQRPPQQQQQRPPQNPGQYGQNGQSSLPSAQNDGAADDVYSQMSMKQRWESLVIATRNVSPEEREQADQIMQQNLSTPPPNQAQPHPIRNNMLRTVAEEDAGILLPTNERTTTSLPKSSRQISTYPQSSTNTGKQRLQVDGGEDSDDAINSDLDDSEDELDGVPADDEGPLGEMILCTWDKVNRVKNKWRCTLKDGILTTGGKEYLFHKATGEFEW